MSVRRSGVRDEAACDGGLIQLRHERLERLGDASANARAHTRIDHSRSGKQSFPVNSGAPLRDGDAHNPEFRGARWRGATPSEGRAGPKSSDRQPQRAVTGRVLKRALVPQPGGCSPDPSKRGGRTATGCARMARSDMALQPSCRPSMHPIRNRQDAMIGRALRITGPTKGAAQLCLHTSYF